MLQIIKKMNVLLDKKQKRTMVGLIILMVISAFLQTAGVGMLVEVMQIVIDPEAVQHSRVAEACYEILGELPDLLDYCHGTADPGIRSEESVYLFPAEADIIFRIHEPVPDLGAHDAQLSAPRV